MKVFIILSALLVVALAAEDKYTTKYDNINVDEILNNERLLMAYFKCLVDKGSCTPDGTELKKVIPDALTNKCSKCNETQRKGAEKVIRFLIDKKQALWKELESKYDPQGIYAEKYRDEAKQHGINVQ